MKIFFTLFICVGLLISLYGVFQLWQSNKSKNWPYVMGVIIESTVEKHTATTYDNQKRKYSYDEYIPYVEYRYTVESGERISDRVFYGWNPTCETKKEALVIIKPFKKGKEVKVFYNPKDESYSVIAHADTTKEKAIIAFGIMFSIMAGGIGCLIYFFDKIS